MRSTTLSASVVPVPAIGPALVKCMIAPEGSGAYVQDHSFHRRSSGAACALSYWTTSPLTSDNIAANSSAPAKVRLVIMSFGKVKGWMLGRSSAEKLQQGLGYRRVSRQATAVPLLHSASDGAVRPVRFKFGGSSGKAVRRALQAEPLNARNRQPSASGDADGFSTDRAFGRVDRLSHAGAQPDEGFGHRVGRGKADSAPLVIRRRAGQGGRGRRRGRLQVPRSEIGGPFGLID